MIGLTRDNFELKMIGGNGTIVNDRILFCELCARPRGRNVNTHRRVDCVSSMLPLWPLFV